MRVIIMLSRKLHSHLACWKWLLGRGFGSTSTTESCPVWEWVVIEARAVPGGVAWLGGALCQRSHVAPQALARSGPDTLSDRELFLPRPSGFEGQLAIPGTYIHWTPSWVIIPNALMSLRNKTNIVWFIDLSRFLAPSFSGGRHSQIYSKCMGKVNSSMPKKLRVIHFQSPSMRYMEKMPSRSFWSNLENTCCEAQESQFTTKVKSAILRPDPVVLVKWWKVSLWNAKKLLKKVTKNRKSSDLNFVLFYFIKL